MAFIKETMFKFKLLLIFPFFLLFTGCFQTDMKQFENNKPKLDLFAFFEGETIAYGIFEDRFGKIKAQFYVDIKGSWDGKTLTLTEDFLYSSGAKDQRIWKIEKIDNKKYTGTALDVIGQAEGESEGNAFTWKYAMKLPYKNSFIKVKLEDWMFLQDEKVLINKADVKKFGFKVGEISIFFKKKK